MARPIKDVTLQEGKVIPASATKQAISKPFKITEAGSRSIVVAVKLSDVTKATGITCLLQTSMDSSNWTDTASATTETNGWHTIKLDIAKAADQTHLPLLAVGRVVISTGGDDAATVDQVVVLQGD